MSNPMKSSECIYPECGPTCRKNCPPLPTKPEPIEPTEEQLMAAQDFVARHGEQNEVIDSGGQARLEWSPTHTANDVACLLAEREAKLREEVYAQAWNLGGISVLATSRTLQDYDQAMARPALNEVAALLKDYDTLRARVAELEAQVQNAAAVRNNLAYALNIHEHREAQHLADIKALMRSCSVAMDTIDVDDTVAARNELSEATERLAHYDDAKVDAPAPPKFRAFDVTERPVAMDAVASCPKCSDDARPVGDGERWVCSVCRRPCRIPLNDTEGGEG